MSFTTAPLRSPTRRERMPVWGLTETPAPIGGSWFRKPCGFVPSRIGVRIGFAAWPTKLGNRTKLINASHPLDRLQAQQGAVLLAALVSFACGRTTSRAPIPGERSPAIVAVSAQRGVSLEVLDWGGSRPPIVFLAGG